MPSEMRLLRVVGALLILLGAYGLFWYGRFWLPPDTWSHVPNPPGRAAVNFMVAVSLYYAAIGVGIWAQTKWGYVLFKSFLYVNLVAVPIGTLLSWLMLRYIRHHRIRRHFGFADV